VFDIGFSELLIVFVVGLLILGPERLPHAAKTAGLWIRKIRRSIDSIQREINMQLDQEELQKKLLDNNQKIMNDSPKDTQEPKIQNKIIPLPEGNLVDNEIVIEPTDNQPEGNAFKDNELENNILKDNNHIITTPTDNKPKQTQNQ